MKRVVVLTALIAAGAVSYVIAQQGGQKPMVVGVEKLKDNLFVLTGGGGNTTVFVQSNGITVVDTKNPGWGAPILAKIQELSPRPLLHVRRVDDRQPGTPQSHLQQPMEELERVVGGTLRRWAVGDEGTHRIG